MNSECDRDPFRFPTFSHVRRLQEGSKEILPAVNPKFFCLAVFAGILLGFNFFYPLNVVWR